MATRLRQVEALVQTMVWPLVLFDRLNARWLRCALIVPAVLVNAAWILVWGAPWVIAMILLMLYAIAVEDGVP